MKYTDKFFTNANVLKNAKVGMEFEFYMNNLSYYKTLEIINNYFEDVTIKGFKEYHPNFKPSENTWLITPDLSGGSNMVELVTGAMSYFSAKMYIVKIMRFIQEYAYTTDKCAVHYNISFDENSDRDLNSLNMLKLILTTDEDEIYRDFPTRKNNIYAKSVKSIIPFKDFDHDDVPINVVINSLRLPNDKYFGINFLHIYNTKDSQRLEFRYVGGKNYQNEYGKILKYLDKFIINTYNSIDSEFNDYEVEILDNYLTNNIQQYNKLNTYDAFLSAYPTVQMMVNQETEYNQINFAYPNFYDTLYGFLESVEDFSDCIINYITESKRLEIVDATINAKSTLYNVDFNNCDISNTIIEKSIIGNCNIINCQLQKCNIYTTDVKQSKIIQSNTYDSKLEDCYFVDSFLDSYLFGKNSVYRSGEIGENGIIEDDVKIVTASTNNFFNTRIVKYNDYDVISKFKDKFKTSLSDLNKKK